MGTKSVVLAIIFACLHSAAFAKPHPQNRRVSIKAVQKFKPPLMLAQVEKAFGPATEQPGPRVSYLCADRSGMSLWFWLRSNQQPGATSLNSEVGCVILATTVKEEQPQVVWPPESIHEPPTKLIQQVTATYSLAR